MIMKLPAIGGLLDGLLGSRRGLDPNKVHAFYDYRDQGFSPGDAARMADLGRQEVDVLQARGDLAERDASAWNSSRASGVDPGSAADPAYQPTAPFLSSSQGGPALPGLDLPALLNPQAGPNPGGLLGSTLPDLLGSTLSGLLGSTAPGLPGSTAPGLPGSTVPGLLGSTLSGLPSLLGLGRPDVPSPSVTAFGPPGVTPASPAPSSGPAPGSAATPASLSPSAGPAVAETRSSTAAERVTGSTAPRIDAPQGSNAPAQTGRPTVTEVVRGLSNIIQTRQDGRHTPSPEPEAAVGRDRGRGNDAQRPVAPGRDRDAAQATVVQARDGVQQQPAVIAKGRTDHGPAQAGIANAAQPATPQLATQSGIAQTVVAQAPVGEQARTQQARFESPIPQTARGGEAAATQATNQPAPVSDRNISTGQQQLHPQYSAAVPQPQAHQDSLLNPLAPQQPGSNSAQGNPQAQRPDAAMAAQAAAVAGATVMTNPRAHTMATQTGQNALPNPTGVDSSAATRAALLAPAGHTLAGFLRRDHRGGQSPTNRPFNWLAAMLPGVRKHLRASEPEVVSTQWLFWTLTIVAYGALGTAAILMVPNGGSLMTTQGAPTAGAYSLVLAALAAAGSWLVGRRMR